MDEQNVPADDGLRTDGGLTSAERRKLKREQARNERSAQSKEQAKKSLVGKVLLGFVALVILAGVGFAFYSSGTKAGSVDKLSMCLKEKGAVIYGNDWCSYTQRQMNMFGKSFGNINYVKCAEQGALCDEKQITVTPTWEIGGKFYREVQTLEALRQVSGC